MTNGETTVGETLRRAREAKKLTVAQVHEATKMSPEVIRSLEQDDFASFASETYVKGFLRNYASYLNLDYAQLAGRLGRKREESIDGGGTFWDIEEAVKEEKLGSVRIFRRVVVPLLLIVIVVLALLLVRERRRAAGPDTGAVPAQVDRGAG